VYGTGHRHGVRIIPREGSTVILSTILIAEDDTAVREFVRRALEHGGHTVHTAHDGIDALAALREAEYDLLITDIVMPGMDGIALALKVAKEWPGMAILMMTGFAAERQRAHNLDSLIHKVVAKPFSLREICEAAEAALLAKARGVAGDATTTRAVHAPSV
jgi:two-component system, cell cycle response regulator CpdR